jgi:hypothetical protein
MVNKGTACQITHTKRQCRLARNGSGDPIYLNAACGKCHEWRCKTHCKCGRLKTATGRNAPRPGRTGQAAAKAQAKPKAAAAQPKAQAKAAPAPVARPFTAEVFDDSSWVDQLLERLRRASTVHAASMIIDDPALCGGLAARLREGGFTCVLVVDKLHYKDKSSRFQEQRLQELKRLGATVFLAQGFSGSGSYAGLMHLKAIVLDSSLAFAGGANFTKAARKNRELMFKFTGSAVANILSSIKDAKESGQQL